MAEATPQKIPLVFYRSAAGNEPQGLAAQS